MHGESVALRIQILKLLRRVAHSRPQYAFERARVFWDDIHPALTPELLGLVADLLPDYFEESLPLVRRHLAMTASHASQSPELRAEVSSALGVLARALHDYPDLVFEEGASFVRQYFGDHDLELAFGQYPLDEAFRLFGEYAQLQLETNVPKVVELLEERFKSWWTTLMKPHVPYDGMKHTSLMTGQINFGSPSLHEDAMVNICLIAPLLAFLKEYPDRAMELVQSLESNPNSFARRAALHAALQLSLERDERGDPFIERAIDSYAQSHDYLSVFQTAESFLVPLAASRPSFAMHLVRKLATAEIGYLGEFEIAALFTLLEYTEEASSLLLQLVKEGSAHRVLQIIKGTEQVARTRPELAEQVLNLAVKRFAQNPDTNVIITVTEAATSLAKRSWRRAKPLIEMVVKSPEWAKTSNIERQLAEVAKANPEAMANVKQLLERLSHDPSERVRESVVSAVAELQDLEGPFGLGLLESLAEDPSPAPEEDLELLGTRIGLSVVIRTVRGAVACFVPHFIRVDESRCWNLLVKLSADKSAYVRMMAVHSLEPYARAQQYLNGVMELLLSGGLACTGLLNDESPWVRHGALRLAFYQLVGNPDAMEKLFSSIMKALDDANEEVRLEAADRVLDAVARSRDPRYLELLQEIVDAGLPEQRSAVAFRIRSYMEKDEAGAFEFFKPLFSVLISDAERQVRENAALSLEDWANTHPEEVAQWCCHLAEAEARSYTGPFSSMAGYHIRLAFSRLVAGRPDQAVVVLDCIQGYPDRYDLNQIVLEVKSLPTQCRGQIRPILERLLKEGLPAAQEVLDSWQSEPADDVDASNGGQST